jgi:hypothetical protein
MKKGVNKITVSGNLLIKKSARSLKSEREWYEHYDIQRPIIHHYSDNALVMDYIQDYKSITDLLSERHKFDTQLFFDIDKYIEKLGLNTIIDDAPEKTLNELLNAKFEERNIIGDNAIILQDLNDHHLSEYKCNMLPHNDLHFGNILYKDGDIITVDPSLYYNNIIYDYAKLLHSFTYDLIIRDLTDKETLSVYRELSEKFILYLMNKGIKVYHVILITANLFYTMIPLHEDLKHRELMRENGKAYLELFLKII